MNKINIYHYQQQSTAADHHHQPITVHYWTWASPIARYLVQSSAIRIQLRIFFKWEWEWEGYSYVQAFFDNSQSKDQFCPKHSNANFHYLL